MSYQSRALIFFWLLLLVLTSLVTSAAEPVRFLQFDSGPTIPLATVDQPRLQGMVGVFDARFGASTLTMPPCTEVVVVDGFVRELTLSGDTPIPAGGMVISANGASGEWLALNAKVGMRVDIKLNDGWKVPSDVTGKIDGVNIPRKSDQLIVYSPLINETKTTMSTMTTSTNSFGIEAVVEDGIVTSVGGNNNGIPVNGFVISGHGKGKEWLTSNIKVGYKVTWIGNTLQVTSFGQAYLTRAELALAQLDKQISVNKSNLTHISNAAIAYRDEAASMVLQAKRLWDEGLYEDAVKQSLAANDIISLAGLAAVNSPSVELRGVWHRPVEKNQQEVAITVERLAKAGFNTIFLETFLNGSTIYPSLITSQSKSFAGWDPLNAYIEECHKRGVEVHSWLHTLRFTAQSELFAVHPQWQDVVKTTTGTTNTEADALLDFADPSNPEVVEFVSSLVKEMASTYQLDGIHLDYIRYADERQLPKGYSYSSASRANFANYLDVDPAILSQSNPTLWKEWDKWRMSNVTSLVKRLRQELLASRRDLALSAAVLGDISAAQKTKLQDWPRWVDEGLLDFATPMTYNGDASWVETASRKISSITGGRVQAASGIGAFLGFSADAISRQIQAARSGGVQGVSVFALHSLGAGEMGALRLGAFNTPAYSPLRGESTVPLALKELSVDLKSLAERSTSMAGRALSVAAEIDKLLDTQSLATRDVLSYLAQIQRLHLELPGLNNRIEFITQLVLSMKRWQMARNSG